MAKVNMEDIKGNSYSDRARSSDQRTTREKLKPVVNGADIRVVKKKKGFLSGIFKEETSELKNRMVHDVIIPGIEHWFLDCLSQLFFHESYRGGGYRNYSGGGSWGYGQREYSSYYGGGSSQRNREEKDRYYKEGIDYRNIVLKNRYDAERIVRELQNRIRDRGYACVADLYDLINVPGDISWENWGWKDERDVRVLEVRDGYLIDVREAGYVGR